MTHVDWTRRMRGAALGLVLLAGGGLVAGTVSASAGQPDADRASAARFITQAVERGQKEIAAGKRTLERSGHGEVRVFADRVVQDLTVSLAELVSLAPAPPPTSEAGSRPGTETAAGAQAAPAPPPPSATADPADRAYLAESIVSHDAMVTLYAAEAAEGKDERLKLWAQAKLPMLREHLAMARALQVRLDAAPAR